MASNNLKKILTKEGVTQAQLARACGVSAGTINKIYNQKRTCAPKTNHKILKGIQLITGKKIDFKEVFPYDKEF